MTCSTCARADCREVGSRANCYRWTNTDDPITADEIAADLFPLSHEECARRGLRHSSEDNHALVPFDLLFDSDLRIAAERIGL